MADAMKLETLHVQEDWANPGTYTGSIKFKGQYGTIEVKLDARLSHRILALVGENMVETTKELAQTLSAEVFAPAPTALTPPRVDDELEPL